FLGVYGRRHERAPMRLSADAVAALVGHTWPGNVRELEHAIERAVVLAPGTVIEAAHLGLGAAAKSPSSKRNGAAVEIPLGLPLDEVQRLYVEATLKAEGGNRTRAAKKLKVGRNTLTRKAKQK